MGRKSTKPNVRRPSIWEFPQDNGYWWLRWADRYHHTNPAALQPKVGVYLERLDVELRHVIRSEAGGAGRVMMQEEVSACDQRTAQVSIGNISELATWARKAWMNWCGRVILSRLEPIKKVARRIKKHLEGILTAVVTGAINVLAKGFNTMIQKIKRDARGFRNREQFEAAVYFHLGGLDLYPDALRK